MAASFADTVKSLGSIVIVIIACAGLLAFIVLYNLTNINICERLREIATIKVLGFYHREVHSYVFRENLLLTIIGALIGLGLGILLHRFIMVSIEQDGIMFGNYIKGMSFRVFAGHHAGVCGARQPVHERPLKENPDGRIAESRGIKAAAYRHEI